MRKLVPLFILLGLCISLDAGIPGDIDDNGSVDLQDIGFIADQWLGTPADPNNPDVAPLPDGDGAVNFLDFAVVADHWLLVAPDPDEMAFVPGGEFQMGDSFTEGALDERPVHALQLDPFYMGRYEITNAQYCTYLNVAIVSNLIYISENQVFGDTGSDPNQPYCNLAVSSSSLIHYADGIFSVEMKSGRDMSDDPVILVSWHGAAAYCNWRSQSEGYQPCYDLTTWECDFTKKGYHLPTEAQWEYAARGSVSGRRFSWDDPNTISHTQANYESDLSTIYDVNPTSGYHPLYDDDVNPLTAPVGDFSSNGYGLYDMTGNVFEWCNDWYDNGYYNISPYSNPTGPASSPIGYHVLRGGGWDSNSDACRVANRYAGNIRRDDFGFRICLNLY